jgi:hypothetical protein
MLIAVTVAITPLLIAAAAQAADVGLFRMKRTWWGGTSTNEDPNPYLSIDYAPGLRGKDARPPAEGYVGFSETPNGAHQAPVPRFTAPQSFIKDTTYYGACVPGTCWPGYPESKGWYSYWNLRGEFQWHNERNGGAAVTTTVVFKTTMGNPTPPRNSGNPSPPTTTPCIGGGHTDCGFWGRDTGTHMAGDRVTYTDGSFDHSRVGSIMVTPGKNRFGGTMHFFYGPNHFYYQYITYFYPKISKAYGPQMDARKEYTDGSAMLPVNTVIGDVQYGGPFNVYRMTQYGQTRATTGDGTPNSPGDYVVIKAPYFYTLAPFTTGMVTGWQPFGNTNSEVTVTGYDNRTPNGLSGVISLVRPRLVHTYKVPPDPNLPIVHTWASAGTWQMNFHFLPEPGSTAMMASGLVVLAGLYRLRRR